MIARSDGFTLIELMVTLVILVISLTIAVPAFQSMLQKNRITGAVNALVADLQLARQEAIKRNQTITLVVQGAGSTNWCYGLDDDPTQCNCTQAGGIGTNNCVIGTGNNAFAKIVQGSNFRDVSLVGGAGNVGFESVRGTANNGAGGNLSLNLDSYTATVRVSGLGTISPCSAGTKKLGFRGC